MEKILENKNLKKNNLFEKVIYVNRVTKVVKGCRRFSFSAIVVVGNKNCQVGVGLGKASEVPEAIKKGGERAKKNIFNISLHNNSIKYKVIGKYCSSTVILKPAKTGTGIIASNTVRAIIEALGINDLVSKCLGNKNKHNIVKATLLALSLLK